MTDPQATSAKRNIVKLQKAIVDGLENVKAQDLQVFDTEHITSLFERVIVASGTSNRQTKALAASVRDSVRQAGFDKPRIEGEDNGEWIIVDCGAAVAHIMQPSIRQYYHLEELWGDKPVRLKPATAPKARAGAARSKDEPAAPAKVVPATAKKAVAKKAPVKAAGKSAPAKAPVAAKKALASPAAKPTAAKAVKKPPADKLPAKAAPAKAASAKAAPARPSKAASAPAKKVASKKTPRKAPGRA
jgi:ribosome-associated protein